MVKRGRKIGLFRKDIKNREILEREYRVVKQKWMWSKNKRE